MPHDLKWQSERTVAAENSDNAKLQPFSPGSNAAKRPKWQSERTVAAENSDNPKATAVFPRFIRCQVSSTGLVGRGVRA